MSATFIYVMSDNVDETFVAPTKIGIAGDAYKRLSSIRTASPINVQLMLALPVPTRTFARAIEGALHEALSNYWLRGEWFSADPIECGITLCTFIKMGYEHIGAKDPELSGYLEKTGVRPVLAELLAVRGDFFDVPTQGTA